MFAELFIRRPRLAAVISVVIFVAGLICAARLPVAEYPSVAPTTITVKAFYPGASAEDLVDAVAIPIEEEINTVEKVLYFSSTSDNSGNYSLTVTFVPNADEDMALVNVNNAVKRTEARLPREVTAEGVTVTKESSDMLCAVVLHSSNQAHTLVDVSTFAETHVKDELARISGVSSVIIQGERKRAMRCWLDPDRMRSLGVTSEEVSAAIASQNLQAAIGSVGAELAGQAMQFKIMGDGRLKTVRDFENIVVRNSKGDAALVRIRDVARVELGAERYSDACSSCGEPGVLVVVFKQGSGNAIEIVDEMLKTMKSIERTMPDGMKWAVSYDPTEFVRMSMREIVETLAETFLLVVLITWLFLQSGRATLIPLVTIPVSLVGTFFFMQVLGLSINTLTMFALILVIGSVVDDAICVTEACMTKLEAGLSAREAAVSTMKEIVGALIASTLVVLAVYAPIGFAQGMVGTIYLQFSLTMCIALVISTVCALTLSPAMAGIVLRKSPPARGFFRLFNVVFDRVRDGAAGVARRMIRLLPATVAVFVAVVAADVWLFRSLPSDFVENEDKGLLFADVTLPPGTALARTTAVVDEVGRRIRGLEGVGATTELPGNSFVSGAGENLGSVIVLLKPWEERSAGIAEVQRRVMEVCADLASARVEAFVVPPIAGLGAAGGISFRLMALAGQSSREIAEAAGRLRAKIAATGKALYALSAFDASTPMLKFDLDRDLAEQMGVKVSDAFSAMQAQLGSQYVNDFTSGGKNYHVNIQADLLNRATVDQLGALHVPGRNGAQVPILSVGRFRWAVGPRQTERFNLRASATFQTQAAPGTSSGELMDEIDRQVAEMGAGWGVAYTDLAYQERKNEGSIVTLLALAVLMAYLFLVGQYESWSVPLPVILSTAVSLLGGLVGIHLSGLALNIYCQLGLLMLVGLTAKSAILMAEYAMQKEAEGLSPAEAAIEGFKQRFRSVQMTVLSFVIGVLPLLFATGAGANARHAVGVTTFWGMVAATVVGLLFVPPLYVLVRPKRKK